jgi:photosystem II stability/assembly factor-like uncharacterized protein
MKKSLGRVMALAAVPLLLLAAGAGSASARPASGSPPPPKKFEVQSASFVSAQTGFVLGARKCSRTDNPAPCPALLEKTVNGGKTWTAVPAPKVPLTQPFQTPPKNAVSTVRFMNANVGWLFNPGLWQTTDGGKHWHSITLVNGFFVAHLEAAAGEVYAIAQNPGRGSDSNRLYQSAVGSGKWTWVRKVAPQVTLTAFGHSAWTGISPNLWTTTNSGKTWSRLSFSCRPDHPDSSPVAAASANNVSIVCVDAGFPQPGSSLKMVYLSANGGRTFALARQQPADAGEVYLLAMPVGKPWTVTIAAASGASYLYESVNLNKPLPSWGVRTFFDGGMSFTDLKYVSGTTAYVVRFNGSPVLSLSLGLWKTTNGGGTWHLVGTP